MFIQSAPAGQPNGAITMYDHAHLSAQFARAFGNSAFEAPDPFDLMVYVIGNHDAGWASFDRDPVTDPQSRLPYSVFATPAPLILPTSRASPDFNERQHSYCGLLSSMHTWGIYNGRYGLSNVIRLDRIAPEDKPAVDAMLAYELARQERIKAELGRSSETAAWIEPDRLFQNYKLLQLCDLLAIYFNYTHAEGRGEQTFTHVPQARDRDTDVTIRPAGPGVYSLSPYPFAAEGIECAFPSRRITAGSNDRDGSWKDVLRTAPVEWERIKFVAG